jgi:hypothetical protein
MTVYNGREHVEEAARSILDQTFDDLELVVVDDGSTDGSADLVRGLGDERVRVFSQGNKGLAAALNAGIAHARGELVARMDADDVSHPDRLRRQVELLRARPDVAVVGTSFDVVDAGGATVDAFWALPHDDDIRRELLVRNPFGHGTTMVRRAVLDDVGGYRLVPIEDYDLWFRVLRRHRGANLPESLYRWRLSPGGMSLGGRDEREAPMRELMLEIEAELGVAVPPPAAARRRAAEYRAVDPRVARQYVADLHAVGVLRLTRGRRREALALFAAAAAADPAMLPELGRLYLGGRAIRGYNLHLVTPPPPRLVRGAVALLRRYAPLAR